MHTSPQTAFLAKDIQVFLFRAPARPPVETSFGVMHSRPAVLLKVVDDEGAHGWGEIWCNFPAVGAEHRARMAQAYLRPLVLGRQWRSPEHCFLTIAGQLEVLALQCGEPGTLHQIAAGLDIAVWDLVARRAGLPLWRLLAPHARGQPAPVPVYASGLNPTDPQELAATKLREGYRAFKLKVGFGSERDDANLRALREVIGGDTPLMVDANQAWSLPQAIDEGRRMAAHTLEWMEEPIRADSSPAQWRELKQAQPLPLAGGENLAGLDAFRDFIAGGGPSIVQPDAGKWGGFTGCAKVGRMAVEQGRRFCPHWLGGAIGQAAALHLKAAVGGPGYVEVDANPNPLREVLGVPAFELAHGCMVLSERAGLGMEPDLDGCRAYGASF